MSIKVMIIDGCDDLRSQLTHQIMLEWRDADVLPYDPKSAGYLPEEFSGAGTDIVLLGDRYGDRDALDTLKQFTSIMHFPPVVYIGSSAGDRIAAYKRLADGFLVRSEISQRDLVDLVDGLLQSRKKQSATDSLFVGDMKRGEHPSIKGYRFVRRLSMNFDSAVFLAEEQVSGAPVVLKILRHVPDHSNESGPFDRFLREYEIVAGIQHPNIVRIHDLTVGDDHAQIAMEYLSGGNLQQQIARGIPEEQGVEYFVQVASALDELHAFGIMHRDLKPGNIMLRDTGTVALIDFGLARHTRFEQNALDEHQIFGTPFYMSPEQGKGGEVDERSDIYSLGVIFYEILTGDRPYRADNAMGVIYRHREDPVPVLPSRLCRYQRLLEGLMAKRPEDRVQTAGEVVEWLN